MFITPHPCRKNFFYARLKETSPHPPVTLHHPGNVVAFNKRVADELKTLKNLGSIFFFFQLLGFTESVETKL